MTDFVTRRYGHRTTRRLEPILASIVGASAVLAGAFVLVAEGDKVATIVALGLVATLLVLAFVLLLVEVARA